VSFYVVFTPLALADLTPTGTLNSYAITGSSGVATLGGEFRVITDNLARIRARCSASGAANQFFVGSRGYIDRRGR
jgi:hypothetical protein